MKLKKLIAMMILAMPLTFAYSSVYADEKVNINTADAKTLSKNLKYIGPNAAKRIVEYREKNGNFKNIDDLTNVKRIGKKVLEVNKDKLTIE